MVGCIYKAMFPNGKGYIGQTVDFAERKKSHSKAALEKDCQFLFHRAIRKYGWDAVEWSTLRDNIAEDKLDTYEKFFISLHGTFGPGGYNMTPGGWGGVGRIPKSAECRQKLREANLGRKASQETKDKIRAAMIGNAWNKGKRLSEETRARMRASSTGFTPESRAKITAARKRNGTNKPTEATLVKMRAYRPTPETLIKMREAQLGKKQSPESKAKKSAALKGRKRPPEVAAKIVATRRQNNSYLHTEETKRRISETLKKRRLAEAAQCQQ